jgi:hypothetical protein
MLGVGIFLAAAIIVGGIVLLAWRRNRLLS